MCKADLLVHGLYQQTRTRIASDNDPLEHDADHRLRN